jgi:hypothetical protein
MGAREAHQFALSHTADVEESETGARKHLDPPLVKIRIDAAQSPDLLGWVARTHGLLAVGSGREPGVVYKSLDPLSGDLRWRNDINHFGVAIEIQRAERDVRLKALLTGTGGTPERLVLALIPDTTLVDRMAFVLAQSGIDRSSEAVVTIGLNLMQFGGVRILEVQRTFRVIAN